MSYESALLFIRKVSKEPELKKKIRNLQDLAALHRLAEENGYSFTSEEFLLSMRGLVTGELNESDLEQVSGGFSPGNEKVLLAVFSKLFGSQVK